MEELGGPRGEGAEEQSFLAVEQARVEVRHGHRGRGVEVLPVDFGVVAGDDCGIVADEPLAADGETAEAAGFGDAGFLEEMQAAAAGTDEDELRAILAKVSGREIFDAHVPAAGGFREIDDAVVVGDAAAFLAGEPAEKFAGKIAEIHIGAAVHFSGGDRALGAALGEERGP